MRRYRTRAESFALHEHHVQAGRTSEVPLLAFATPCARQPATIPAPPFPRDLHVAQRRAAAHGQAARPAGAGRVLGLLPRQLAAHAALPEGLARALRGRGPARDRRAHRRRSRPRATRRRSCARGRAARDPVPGRDRHGARDLGLLRQRGLARRATCGTPSGALFSMHYGEGAYARDRAARSRSCSASSATPLAPVRPEDEPGRAAAGPDRGPARRLLRALRGRRRVGGAVEGAASCASTARAIDDRRAGLPPARRAPAPHRGRARARGRRRASTCHATCFTPGRGRAPRARARPAAGRAAAARRRRRTTAVPGQ